MKASRTFKISSNTYSFLYRLLDIATIVGSFWLALAIYGITSHDNYLIAMLITLVVYLYTAEFFEIYRTWRVNQFQQMVLTTWAALIVAFLSLILSLFLVKQTSDFSRVTIAIWFSQAFVLMFSWRYLNHKWKVTRRKLGFNLQKMAIIGATERGEKLFNEVAKHNELGYDFVGFYDDRDESRTYNNLTIMGNIDQAVDEARDGKVDVLFIALPSIAEQRLLDIILKLGDTTVDVHIVPDLVMSGLMHARIDHIGQVDTLSVFESPYLGAKNWIKRLEDIIVSLLIILLIAPLLLAIAVGIKLTSKGPVLFKQRRYGLRGEEIQVWKFRSMTVMEDNDKVIQATRNDARITPFGGFLRRTSLDELPQFFNVLAGHMSVVGPRPHAVAHNEEYRGQVQYYMLRHQVKPGITGWAQISGWRGETDTLEKMEKRIEFDLQYIRHWTVFFDIKIIFLTIFKGFVNKNAY
ncbi:undecaprenyl-phosphate glucose phosphotransferase [Moritella yayanosii]|uniref:Putative UDP-sugar lipid carrier transferase n=1 Tax=Moritella yayanosii TaxID=69539 RepID=A0A330LSP6_9GAMM|nr:undecaprenyl-phosphate glucose phosphotransferase [Moritella yayanosii]SQD79763.1 putative UDP-sugar lipid carrier transferase [Moritella yayanosii]